MSEFVCVSLADTQALGEQIGRVLKRGDVVILNGPLGAGKTSITQGIAKGLNVRGPITSPTFVISRIHPSLSDGPSLIHVDAYRVSSLAEIDDLDIDSDLENSVLVAEWGAGKVDALVEPTCVINLERHDDDTRTITVNGIAI
jgi:tRNA threonylcarbamoyladenosine biosynthesis protein TsaE